MTVDTTHSTLGTRFAEAVATKDADALRELLDPDIDFRGVTPGRFWEAHNPEGVCDIVFGSWFEPSDETELRSTETDAFADRQRIGYRFAARNPDGEFLVEQTAYFAERDGRIDWMRV